MLAIGVSGFLAPYKVRTFALLSIGDMVNHFGDLFLMVAMPLLVYDRTGSALAAGIAFFAQRLPFLLVAPLAGAVSDRLDRKRLLVAANILQAAVVCAIPFIGALWQLYVLIAISSTLAAFDEPIREAVIPEVLKGDLLQSGLSLHLTGLRLADIIGPAVAGILVGAIGSVPAILVDGASFLIAAGLAAVTVIPPLNASDKSEQGYRQFLAQIGQGFQTIWQHNILLQAIWAGAGAAAIAGSLPVLLVALVKRFQWPAEFYGYALTALAVAGIVGTLGARRIKTPVAQQTTVFALPALVSALVMMAAFAGAKFLLLVGVLALLRLYTGAFGVISGTLIGRSVNYEVRARIASLRMAAQMSGAGVGALAAGFLADVGGQWSFFWLGVAFVVTVALPLALIYVSRRGRERQMQEMAN